MKTEEKRKEIENLLFAKLRRRFIERIGTQEIEFQDERDRFHIYDIKESTTASFIIGIRYNSITDKIEFLIQDPSLGKVWKSEQEEENEYLLRNRNDVLITALGCVRARITSLDGDELQVIRDCPRDHNYNRRIIDEKAETVKTFETFVWAQEKVDENKRQDILLSQELRKRFINKFGAREVELKEGDVYLFGEDLKLVAYLIGLRYDPETDKLMYKLKYENTKQEIWKDNLEEGKGGLSPLEKSNNAIMIALNVKQIYTLTLESEELARVETLIQDTNDENTVVIIAEKN